MQYSVPRQGPSCLAAIPPQLDWCSPTWATPPHCPDQPQPSRVRSEFFFFHHYCHHRRPPPSLFPATCLAGAPSHPPGPDHVPSRSLPSADLAVKAFSPLTARAFSVQYPGLGDPPTRINRFETHGVDRPHLAANQNPTTKPPSHPLVPPSSYRALPWRHCTHPSYAIRIDTVSLIRPRRSLGLITGSDLGRSPQLAFPLFVSTYLDNQRIHHG